MYSAVSARTFGWGLGWGGGAEAQPAAGRASPATRPGTSAAVLADRADLAGDIRQPLRYALVKSIARPTVGSANWRGQRLNDPIAGYQIQDIGATCQRMEDRYEAEMAGASGTGCRGADSGWMQQFR